MPNTRPEKTGKLRFKLQQQGSIVTATILAARGLKDLDFMGKNDVYVIVIVNGELIEKTVTNKNAGANTTWNGSDGEILQFELGDSALDSIELQVFDFDEDFGDESTDDMIGNCLFPAAAFQNVEWEWEGSRIIHAPREAQVDEPAEEPKAINGDNNVIGSSAFEVEEGPNQAKDGQEQDVTGNPLWVPKGAGAPGDPSLIALG